MEHCNYRTWVNIKFYFFYLYFLQEPFISRFMRNRQTRNFNLESIQHDRMPSTFFHIDYTKTSFCSTGTHNELETKPSWPDNQLDHQKDLHKDFL